MPDQMFIVLTLRKPVPDAAAARQIYDLVKDRLSDHPDVEISGHCTNHFDLDQEPPT
ncbi:hypothetical protein ES703_113909 [subsurface metagenome]